MTKKIIGLTSLLSLVALQAGATGYEQTIEWSGRYSSIGGIGVQGQGAEALYFNPAGLARGTVGSELSFNISPQQPVSKGPISSTSQLTSDSTTAATGSLLYNYNITPDLGVGIGAYVGAGATATFDNVSFAGLGFSSYTKFRNQVADEEVSLGVGYQIIPGLRVGAAWRTMFIKAEVAGASVSALPASAGGGEMLTYFDHSGLSDRQMGGYRLGAQYSPSKDWGIGLAYRSRVSFYAHGTTQGTYEIIGNGGGMNGTHSITSNSATTVSSTLPDQYTLGGFYNITDTWHLYLGAELAKYSSNQNIEATGSFGFGVLGTKNSLPISQGSSDQSTYRIGAEYAGWDWPIRFGFIYQTVSENSNYASAAFFAPGNNMTGTLGTGHKIVDGLNVDAGLAYSTDTADVSDAVTGKGVNGSYSSTDWALHAGLTYVF